MRLVKILITTEEQGDIINNVLVEAEENGEIDFGFSVRVTEPMDDDVVKNNFYNESKDSYL